MQYSVHLLYIWLIHAFHVNQTHDRAVASAVIYHLSYENSVADNTSVLSISEAFILDPVSALRQLSVGLTGNQQNQSQVAMNAITIKFHQPLL